MLEFDYKARSPWDTKEEFVPFFEHILKNRRSVTIVANSIGAFFAMHALQGMGIKKAYFISSIVNMQKLIEKMMSQVCVSEEKLRDRGELDTECEEKLSSSIPDPGPPPREKSAWRRWRRPPPRRR